MLKLTREVRHSFELLLPILGDFDGLCLHILALNRVSLLIGMLHDLLQILWVHGVQNIEEVLPRWTLVLWKCVREVLLHFFVFRELRVQIADGEFIIMWYVNRSDFVLSQQLLLAGENVSEKVFVYGLLIRQIKLDCKKSIRII